MKQSTTPATEQILHTQGEWKTEYCLDGGVFINAGERCIACIQTEEDNPPTKEDEANAELIVKAVNERQALLDLINECKSVLTKCEYWIDGSKHIQEEITNLKFKIKNLKQ